MNQPTHSNQDNRRINLPLQTRMASLEDAVGMDNGADRTFNVVFTTGATVRRYDYMNAVVEVLQHLSYTYINTYIHIV